MSCTFGRLRPAPIDPGDKMLIDDMRNRGEKLLTQARETTHYLTFDSEDTARSVADLVVAGGFRAIVEPPGDGVDRWTVQAVHTIFVGEYNISIARNTLTGIAAAAGGVYDGWDTYSDAAIAHMPRSDRTG